MNSAATITLRPAVADYPVGARTGRRVIGDHELVWMTRGRARFSAPDEGELELRPGLLLLVPPGRLHEFAWDEQGPCQHGYVHFRPASGTAPTHASIRPMTEHDPLAGVCSYLLWLGAERPTRAARSATCSKCSRMRRCRASQSESGRVRLPA